MRGELISLTRGETRISMEVCPVASMITLEAISSIWRNQKKNFNKEIHVDLQSWMIILSDFMSRFAYQAGDKENGDLYSQ
jgi:hypothetical protein